MRILLVNPTLQGEPEAFHLGLATIATYLRLHTEHEAQILDFAFDRKQWEDVLARKLEEFRPDVVGIYVSSPFFPSARKIAQRIKRVAPHVRVLAGGHHATLEPDVVFSETAFDLLIVGEGEIPIVVLLDVLAAGRPLDEVPGLWFREGGETRKTDKAPPLEAKRIPAIDWDFYEEKTLRESFYFFGLLPIMGSRGCPYRCSFCAITNVQRLYKGEQFLRFRDPIEVVDEIERHYETYRHMGLRLVYFYDLNFLIRPEWLKTFTDEYKRRGLADKLKWSAYTRADHVSKIVAEYLEGSGCVALRVGIEAANETQRNAIYNKALPQEELLEAIRRIKRAGIAVTGYFLAGGPGERPEWLLESLELAYDMGIEHPVFFLYKPLAGTDVLERAAEMGSQVDTASLDEAADFIHGVNMTHEHVTARQLVAFVYLTQVVFGARLLLHQIRKDRLAFFTRLAEYAARGFASGFTPHEVLVYYAFYGYDHLADPPRFPVRQERSLAARALFGVLRRVMRSKDGGPSATPVTPAPPPPKAPLRDDAVVPLRTRRSPAPV